MQSGGQDSDGNRYRNAGEMWEQEVATPSAKDCWYTKGIDYWNKVDATVDGVLGGFGRISPNDLKHSNAFLQQVMGEAIARAKEEGRELVVADCGAGVGRITKGLLSKHFTEVDVIEPVEHFLSQAKVLLRDCGAKVNFLLVPLQEVTVQPDRYDVVWIQWCIGHLTDDDCVAFLQICAQSLKPGGLIVVSAAQAEAKPTSATLSAVRV
mmetsp:Transcript_4069/g.10286  ORF Transcript_4069/g.10286 Transcript_4069/m.10286 type:complete len:209 (-) Transcript_4069:220-846(-)